MKPVDLAVPQDQPSTEHPEPSFYVIIPAHDEEAVIERCLAALQESKDSHFTAHVLVIANGCSDQTAEIARRFDPSVEVIEVDRASKSNAINIGLSRAGSATSLILDADVVCDFRTLEATVQALLEPGTLAASPVLRIEAEHSSKTVQRYYKVWESLPYATERLIGGGLYGLSARGMERLGSMPEIIADDLYVRSHFELAERKTISKDLNGNDVFITMYPPRRTRDLIRIEARRWRGTRELKALLNDGSAMARNGIGSMVKGFYRSFGLIDLTAYLAIKFCGRLLAITQTIGRRAVWDRDESTRVYP